MSFMDSTLTTDGLTNPCRLLLQMTEELVSMGSIRLAMRLFLHFLLILQLYSKKLIGIIIVNRHLIRLGLKETQNLANGFTFNGK